MRDTESNFESALPTSMPPVAAALLRNATASERTVARSFPGELGPPSIVCVCGVRRRVATALLPKPQRENTQCNKRDYCQERTTHATSMYYSLPTRFIS